jgi:hypothetical protein
MTDNKRGAPKRRTLRPEDDPYPPAVLRRRMEETERVVLAATGPDDPQVRALMADADWMIHYRMALHATVAVCGRFDPRYYERDPTDGSIHGIRRDVRQPYASAGRLLYGCTKQLDAALARKDHAAAFAHLLACVAIMRCLDAWQQDAKDHAKRAAAASKRSVPENKVKREFVAKMSDREDYRRYVALLKRDAKHRMPRSLGAAIRAYQTSNKTVATLKLETIRDWLREAAEQNALLHT